MDNKLFDSELKVLEILWDEGELPAREIAARAAEQVGWSKTTTYTMLKKCALKGLIERQDPGFVCKPLISREQARTRETRDLINRMYSGSADRLVASLVSDKVLSKEEISHLRRLVEELK